MKAVQIETITKREVFLADVILEKEFSTSKQNLLFQTNSVVIRGSIRVVCQFSTRWVRKNRRRPTIFYVNEHE